MDEPLIDFDEAIDDFLSDFDDRLLASFVLDTLDYDAHLRAIHGLLNREKQADEELARQIQKIDAFARRASGIVHYHAVDEWVAEVHHSGFQEAARSMAAVGMLAPFTEALFKRAFQGINDRFVSGGRITLPSHKRWKMPPETMWDCGFVSTSKRSNLVRGIIELAEATGLKSDLPAGIEKTLTALFTYRNKMFHHGFEWPIAMRVAFENTMKKEGWSQDWFGQATSGNEPWMFYLSEKFIEHCLVTIEGVLSGLGAFVRRND
jgi:hypothetical protein